VNLARSGTNIGHHIKLSDDTWWRTLLERGEICARFDNQPGDRGEKIFKSYVAGDRVIAYASSHGAIGWGIIEQPASYRLLAEGDPADIFPDHFQRHRLNIAWKAAVATVKDGVPPSEIMKRFKIHHPISTCVRVADRKADELILLLSETFAQV